RPLAGPAAFGCVKPGEPVEEARLVDARLAPPVVRMRLVGCNRPAWMVLPAQRDHLQHGRVRLRPDPPQAHARRGDSLLERHDLGRGIAEDGGDLFWRDQARASAAARSCTSCTRRARSSGLVSGRTPWPRLKT